MDGPTSIRRPELYELAARLARALCARYGAALPSDARAVLGFWQASERGLERAAEQLIAYAEALGIADPDSPPPSSRRCA